VVACQVKSGYLISIFKGERLPDFAKPVEKSDIKNKLNILFFGRIEKYRLKERK
jgi:hypothetical protein